MKAFYTSARVLQSALTDGLQFDATCQAARVAASEWERERSATALAPHPMAARTQQLTDETNKNLRAAIAASIDSKAVSGAPSAASVTSGGVTGSGGIGGGVLQQIDEAERAARELSQDAQSALNKCACVIAALDHAQFRSTTILSGTAQLFGCTGL